MCKRFALVFMCAATVAACSDSGGAMGDAGSSADFSVADAALDGGADADVDGGADAATDAGLDDLGSGQDLGDAADAGQGDAGAADMGAADMGAADMGSACSPGTVVTQTGCDPCQAGTFQPDLDGTTCMPCPQGRFSGAGAEACTPCDEGRSTGGQTGQASCEPCPEGRSTGGLTGQASCTPCDPGFVAPTTGASVCSPCMAGQTQPLSGQLSCMDCSPGSFAPSAGAIACDPCPLDTYVSSSGASACTACPVDTCAPVGSADVSACVPCVPVITSLSASSGSAGQTVTINGARFSSTAANNVVSFGGLQAMVTSASSSMLTVVVPAGSGSAVDVTVTRNGQTSNVVSFDFVPALQMVTPSTAFPGQVIILTGTGFSGSPSANTVTIGGQTATVAMATSTELEVVVPPGIGTDQAVHVTVGGQPSNTIFFSYAAPELTGLSPSSGTVGAMVTISGNGFDANGINNDVTFGGVPAMVVGATATTLNVVVPAGSGAGVTVTVTVLGQTSNSQSFDYL